jgi:hypothetical protein
VIGSILAGLAALAFVSIGFVALAAPRFSAAQYGLCAEGPAGEAFVRALGARDLALGGIIAALLASGGGGNLAWALAISAIVGAADFFIVRAAGQAGAKHSCIVHAAGTTGLLIAAAAVAATQVRA